MSEHSNRQALYAGLICPYIDQSKTSVRRFLMGWGISPMIFLGWDGTVVRMMP